MIVIMNIYTSKHPVAACAFFICSALTVYAAKFGDISYVEHDTTIEITDYPENANGDLIIPSEIVGKPVTTIGPEAFWACRNLTSVTIPNSVTSIGDFAFWNCTSLTAITVDAANPAYSSVDGVLFDKDQTTLIQWPGGRAGAYTIPDSVTSIGIWAFSYCSSLSSVAIPDSVTSIEWRTFQFCTSLTSVYFKGGSPDPGSSVFEGVDDATVYYLAGTTGWAATYGDRPTEVISVLPDPLIGGTPVDAPKSWFLSEWFGIYYTYTDSHWLSHDEHGFIYRYPESTNANLYFYDYAMGVWWWTNRETYPFIHRFSDGVWLWYLEGSSGPRWFYNLGTESWESWHPKQDQST